MGSLQFPYMGMGLRLAAFGRRSSAINITVESRNNFKWFDHRFWVKICGLTAELFSRVFARHAWVHGHGCILEWQNIIGVFSPGIRSWAWKPGSGFTNCSLQLLSVTRALQRCFRISKTAFWWTSIKCIHDNNGERSFKNHYFNVNSQSIRVALSSLLDSSINRNWEVRLLK